MRELVPLASQRVLDIGMGLKASRVALLHRGVERLVGVAREVKDLHQRAKSYDALWRIDQLPLAHAEFDAIMWVTPERCDQDIDWVLGYSREWLVPGGRVVFTVTLEELSELEVEPELSTLDAWLISKGFRLVHYVAPALDTTLAYITAVPAAGVSSLPRMLLTTSCRSTASTCPLPSTSPWERVMSLRVAEFSPTRMFAVVKGI